MDYTKGNIYILNLNSLTKQEVTLLSFLARRYIRDISDFLYVNNNEEKNTNILDSSKE